MQQITLITGGSRGLGKHMALALAARGHDLILTYQHNASAAAEVQQQVATLGRKAELLPLDVADSNTFADFAKTVAALLLQHWQGAALNHLVNNAGIGLHQPLAATTEAQFDELYRIHLKGPMFLTQALLPLLSDGGSVLNISSGLARFAINGAGAYAAMKGAIEVLTRYWAKELGPRQIRVNVLAPGAIETDFSGGVVRDNPEMNQYVASQTALGRAGLPTDIGDAVALLLSEEARWITAQRIEASGGMFI
jgi:NAD(P)-dependent dehydrogenase (short-subunit alcohol dehydrogenase family)